MDNVKIFGILSAVFMLSGSLLIVLSSNSSNTAVKIFCVLIGGVMSVVSGFCILMAMDESNNSK